MSPVRMSPSKSHHDNPFRSPITSHSPYASVSLTLILVILKPGHSVLGHFGQVTKAGMLLITRAVSFVPRGSCTELWCGQAMRRRLLSWNPESNARHDQDNESHVIEGKTAKGDTVHLIVSNAAGDGGSAQECTVWSYVYPG